MHDRVVIFEPLPEAAAACRQRYAENPKVVVFEAACGEESGIQSMNVYNAKGLSSSLGKITEVAEKTFYMHDLSLRESLPVHVVRLDAILSMLGVGFIECLAIDAQGMDFAILKTVEPWIRKSQVGYIQLEADGKGFRHYEGTPDNSECAVLEYMSRFETYQATRHPNRLDAQPDLIFVLK
jgi:FkbM family methyltransferase